MAVRRCGVMGKVEGWGWKRGWSCAVRLLSLVPLPLHHHARAHRHAELVLGLRVAEQPRLLELGAHAVAPEGLDFLQRCACPGVRRRAGGARRGARVMVERAADSGLLPDITNTIFVSRVFFSYSKPRSSTQDGARLLESDQVIR